MAARIWHKAPFIRLLAALATGILLQWHLSISFFQILLLLLILLLLAIAGAFMGIRTRYQSRLFTGSLLLLIIGLMGCLSVWKQDIRNHPQWIGHQYEKGQFYSVTVQEPLIEKTNSWKALARLNAVYEKTVEKPAEGKIILYFKKDSTVPPLQYGNRLLMAAPLQILQNSGNPGSFDYKTYSLFQGITHQVFIGGEDYVVLPGMERSRRQHFLFTTRAWVIGLLRTFIQGKKELGLAEALLIGYKDDLDKTLIQAYSNTGVVHIIAISGLHLGIIYAILLLLTRPLKRLKHLLFPRLLIILGSLWLFSLLAGAGPSVLRSAVMFSLIAIGETTLKKTNIFNTLAFSAFVLLCLNPFWLWDVGFQLSYSAVLSIVLFFRPVYQWFQFSNKGVDFLWKISAVTIAAQILTLPVSIYHFHQMPLLFWVTNFVAVPLSTAILLGEILLCFVSFLPILATQLGRLIESLIGFMNHYIEGLDRLPFATWNALSITVVQTALLLAFVFAFSYWLMEKQRQHGWIALCTLTLFMLIRGHSFYKAYQQQKMIVYNTPKLTAIDVIQGRTYYFFGDSQLLQDGFPRNFHLQPSRILHRISPVATALPHAFTLGGKTILIGSEALSIQHPLPKPKIDVLVLTKNPKLYMTRLQNAFELKQVVVDGSVPAWKAALWKKDCDSLRIPFYNVSERGAYVMNW